MIDNLVGIEHDTLLLLGNFGRLCYLKSEICGATAWRPFGRLLSINSFEVFLRVIRD